MPRGGKRHSGSMTTEVFSRLGRSIAYRRLKWVGKPVQTWTHRLSVICPLRFASTGPGTETAGPLLILPPSAGDRGRPLAKSREDSRLLGARSNVNHAGHQFTLSSHGRGGLATRMPPRVKGLLPRGCHHLDRRYISFSGAALGAAWPPTCTKTYTVRPA